LNADQEALAESMRTAWANFAATGNPSSDDLAWPSIGSSESVLSFVSPHPTLVDDFASAHHCGFWAAS
jgi:para-nitrobenzyl esterase